MCGRGTFDWNQLARSLSDLHQIKIWHAQDMYLSSCKARLLSVHLAQSSYSARVRHGYSHDGFLVFWWLDTVSWGLGCNKKAISLCWHTMYSWLVEQVPYCRRVMTRRASSVLPESNTGEECICPAPHPYVWKRHVWLNSARALSVRSSPNQDMTRITYLSWSMQSTVAIRTLGAEPILRQSSSWILVWWISCILMVRDRFLSARKH